MSHRFLSLIGILALAIAVVSLTSIAAQVPTTPAEKAPAVTKAPAAAKAPATAKAPAAAKASARKWAAPKTPWGDPDLQGVWNDATSTPLQRPSELGGKDTLSDEEAAGFEEQLAFNLTRDRRDGGPEADVVFQMVGGLRSGMGYCGVCDIAALRTETEFIRITTAGLRESHPHDVVITREAPNYSL